MTHRCQTGRMDADAPARSGALDSPRAWSVAGAAFVVGFVVFGIVYSFGIFVPPMMRDLNAGLAAISVLFSATGVGFYMLGPLTGHLGDRFGPRRLVGAGAALMGAGLALSGCIDRVWTGYFTYGALVGLGAACAYLPALAIVGGWFERHRDAALGVAAAGTGFGTMVVPPLAAGLIERLGWRPTLWVLGAGSALLLALCSVVVRRPPDASAAARRRFRRAVLSLPFATLYLSWVLATMALFVPFVFLPSFAVRLGVTQTDASALISVIGGMSILGRVGIGWATARYGTVGLFKIAVLVMGGSYLLWLTAASYPALLLFTVVLGLGYGVRIALVPGVLIAFFGLQNLGALLGVFFTATGVATVLGPLLAGAVADASGDFAWAIGCAAVLGGLGFLVLVPLRAGGAAVAAPGGDR